MAEINTFCLNIAVQQVCNFSAVRGIRMNLDISKASYGAVFVCFYITMSCIGRGSANFNNMWRI